jgi:hypothetical protein
MHTSVCCSCLRSTAPMLFDSLMYSACWSPASAASSATCRGQHRTAQYGTARQQDRTSTVAVRQDLIHHSTITLLLQPKLNPSLYIARLIFTWLCM